MDVLADVRDHRRRPNEAHFKITPFQEDEDIQDFLEAFEGIMRIQQVEEGQWVLRLTPLLRGKARAVCTDIEDPEDYKKVKEAILDHYSVTPERCRKRFRAHRWTRDAEPNEWIARGQKLLGRWLPAKEEIGKVLDKIAVEHYQEVLPQELRIWVASHSPTTPAEVAKLIESYDSAYNQSGRRRRNYREEYKPPGKTPSQEPSPVSKPTGDQTQWNRENRPMSSVTCFKCNKKGHYTRNCPEKNLRVQEGKSKGGLYTEGEINGRLVKRIQIDSGASRTVVKRSLISPADIDGESIKVTFGNGTSGEYPLASVRVKLDNEEYQVNAAIVHDLAEEVLLGRDVPLHKHIVRCLPKEEQMDLLCQIVRENKEVLRSEENTGTALSVMTRAQKRSSSQKSSSQESSSQKSSSQESSSQKSSSQESSSQTSSSQGSSSQKSSSQESSSQESSSKESSRQKSSSQESSSQRSSSQESSSQKSSSQEGSSQESSSQESSSQRSSSQKSSSQEGSSQESSSQESSSQRSSSQESSSQEGSSQESSSQNSSSQKSNSQKSSRQESSSQKSSSHEGSSQESSSQESSSQDSSSQESSSQESSSHENSSQKGTLEEDFVAGSEFPFVEELFGVLKDPRVNLTRAEKRRNRLRWTKTSDNTTTAQLKKEQEEDPDIQKWIAQEDPSRVKRVAGVLCRIWSPRDSPHVTHEQIVLPKHYRQKVIKIAHDLPFAGHLGREKTIQRILRRFYWPTLFHDVRSYCQTCEECQLHKGRRNRAPMIPLPIIGEPFKRIAMDIVGPLPRSSRGNRFILVLSDYATRYPEAIPLRKITAKHVAEALIDIFARHGIPQEILTDQGANFTSSLLGELHRLIGTKALKTTPYHPQTDGLVERFNKTLKSMLRRVLKGEKRDWDRMLPFVLFAYREVPQATVGFSPFELVYGRDVRGPLDVLQEDWIKNADVETDVLHYVMDVRERMEAAREIVEENARTAQQQQKTYYDKKTRETNLQEGDKVLLLFPTSTKKFIAQWQGPYKIVRRIGKVNYEIEMPDKGGRKQVYHINHLRKWQERSCTVNAVIEDQEEMEECQWTNKNQLPKFGNQLSKEQKEEINQLLISVPRVVRDNPGRTDRTTHWIRTTDNTPIRQKPYRIPQAYQEGVLEELKNMEENGIIEKSESEWASPLVVVTEKDGGLRLCVDYRRLNQLTKFDAYPMPRIEEMLDKIGNAQFITTLDLAKGYWQVPLCSEDKEKTAFPTPKGLYQFTTMPFGLSGAPATFQRMMDSVLRDTEQFTGVYLDDIIIYSDSWEDHLEHLKEILRRLSDANLTLKLKKCVFAAEECTYLGHQIGRGGVRPEESKIQAVAGLPRPTTKKDVRTFLGMAGYYRRFVQHFATIAEPLTELTKKNKPDKIV